MKKVISVFPTGKTRLSLMVLNPRGGTKGVGQNLMKSHRKDKR